MQDKPSIWRYAWWVIAILLFYWLSEGFLFRWEESAHTYKQYLSRQKVRYCIYAPVRCLQSVDPTGTLSALHSAYARLWLNPNFESGKLPDE